MKSEEKQMKNLGIVRNMDELGRVVIPMEVRRTNGWEPRTPLEILATDEGVFIRKYQPRDSEKEKVADTLIAMAATAKDQSQKDALTQAVALLKKN
jgi:bifunctional DNA-binding transcriptional regulator/antitoxin component of YhaV-PrlF toxin-antitoxin module